MTIGTGTEQGGTGTGTGRVHWGTAGIPHAEQSRSAAEQSRPAVGPVGPLPLGERLRYDALTRGFVRVVGLSALVERTLIVKPS